MSSAVRLVSLALALVLASSAGAAMGPTFKLVGTWGTIGTQPGQFSSNSDGIATDPAGNVYVADTDNNRIQVFDANGTLVRLWGVFGDKPGEFQGAQDVDIAPDGTVWVADELNSRAQQFSAVGDFLNSVSVSPELPRGIAVDDAGNVLLSSEGGDSGGIRRFGSGPAVIGESKYRPGDVEASPDGSIYLRTSTSNGDEPSIRRFGSDGSALGVIPTSGAFGGIAVDLDCNVWVGDFPQRRLVKLSPAGKLLATAASPDLVESDIAVGPTGDLYVIHQDTGIVHFEEDHAHPAQASVPAKVAVAKSGTLRVPYMLSQVACPAVVTASATLTGTGIAGKASGLKLPAGKQTTISFKLSKSALKKAAAKGKATFKIVLGTNGRKTTEVRKITVSVPASLR